VYRASRRGFGFVAREGGRDVYIPRARAGGAIDGDEVEVRLLARRRAGGAREGEVVRVLARARRTLVGRFERRGKLARVTPTDRRLAFDVMVDRRAVGDAVNGDVVEVEILRYPDRDHDAQGRVTVILGAQDDPSIEIEVIIREHALRTEFGEHVLEEAAEAPSEVGADEAGASAGSGPLSRLDLRHLFTVTIDGEDARDFDDAISISRVPDGFELWTHIADVSHYVGLESALFAEAGERATSVYLVDRVLPMLPHELSNGICSLNPNVDRLAMSVRMEVDRQGRVIAHEVTPSVIASDHRLTYEAVDEWFQRSSYPSAELAEMLATLRDLMKVLEAKRVRRGGLDFDTVEAQVKLGEDGTTPLEVVVRKRTTATQLIEEAMILTNEVVAEHMHAASAPMVYRVHDPPDPDSLDSLAALIDELGYPMGAIGEPNAATFQRIIDFARGRPEELLLNRMLLRTMKQARYKAYLAPHFGLASECYTHFTSPIRRFPDLLVHHLVKAALGGRLGAPSYRELAGELAGHADHSSFMEREADVAERESVEVKVCELMKHEIGESFEGVVSGVASYGLWVELPNTAEGLVHVSELDDDYYRFEPARYQLVGEHTGRRIRLGQAFKVRLVNVSVGERRLDFVPA
jgi:ribonuclease R